MKKAFLFIFLLGTYPALAQDYVVTTRNDTLRGVAKILEFDILDRIDLIDGKKKNHFTCIQIKTLSMNGETFSPIKGSNGYRLMKLVKPGYLSLYLGKQSNTMSSPNFHYDVQYLVKRDGSVQEVPNLGFKKAIIRFLDDCKSLKDKIVKENLGKKDLDQIITFYNECIESQTISSRIDATPAVGSEDPTLIALGDLKAKLEAGQLPNRRDAIDILNDMSNKVKSRQPVPNYLMEGLKGLLKDSPEYQSDLEKVISLVAKK